MKRCFTYLLFLLVPAFSPASSDEGGTESPFNFGAGARDLAMGGANIASGDFASASFWNPSRLIRAEQYTFGGFHSRLYESDVAYQFVGFAAPTMDFGSLGIGIFRLGIGGIEKRDAGDLRLGEFDDNHLAIFLAYARGFSGYDIGISINVEHKSIDNFSTTSSPGINLSIGRRFDLHDDRLVDLSVVLQGRNIVKPGLKLVDDRVTYPMSAELGISAGVRPIPRLNQQAVISAAVTKVDYLDPEMRLGLEYNLEKMIMVRGGFRGGKFSVGIGISYKILSFDYALVDRDMGSLHLFGLITSFGMPISKKRENRQIQREAEFNQLMQNRLISMNREKISELITEGENLLSDGSWSKAQNRFDRALFLARGTGEDTARIASLAARAGDELNRELRNERYGNYFDSAKVNAENGNYISARHFVTLALNEIPESQEASGLLAEIDDHIRQMESREDMIQSQLHLSDSLLSYGRIEQAINILASLMGFAPDYPRVSSTYQKAMFERWRGQASNDYSKGRFESALSALDSALELYPGHGWCLDMKDRIARESVLPADSEAKPEPKPKSLSPELQREVAAAYEAGQKHFKVGELNLAIIEWERVELLAPDYTSVRSYLVNAYKFVGVELYSQNKFEEAVETWQKASRLEPDNAEIKDYIKRTTTEIRKLQELSYGR